MSYHREWQQNANIDHIAGDNEAIWAIHTIWEHFWGMKLAALQPSTMTGIQKPTSTSYEGWVRGLVSEWPRAGVTNPAQVAEMTLDCAHLVQWQELKWNNNNVESSSHLVTHCMPKWWEFGQQWPSARGLALRLQSNFSEQLMSWSLRLLEMEMCTICTHQIPLKMKDLGSDRIISWSPTLNVFFYYFCKVKSNHQLQLWS